MKFLKTKKAAWGPAPTLLDWTAYIVLVIAIVLAIIIFSWSSSKMETKINTYAVSQESDYLMLNILRTPVKEENTDNIADLISMWYLSQGKEQEKLENQLLEEISKIIDNIYQGKMHWKLAVSGNTKKEIKTIDPGLLEEFISTIKSTLETEIETDIPINYNSNELSIKLKLSIYVNTVEHGTFCFQRNLKACDEQKEKECTCEWDVSSPKWNCKQCPTGFCDPIEKKCV